MSIGVRPRVEKDPTVSDPNKSGGGSWWNTPHEDADEFERRAEQREEARERRRERERERDRQREREQRSQQPIDRGLEEMPIIIDDTTGDTDSGSGNGDSIDDAIGDGGEQPEEDTGLPDPPTFSGEGDFAGALASLFEGSAPVVIPGQPAPQSRPLPWTAFLVIGLLAVGGWWLWRKYGK